MRSAIATALFLTVSSASAADLSVSAFYDIERRLAITEANWFAKLPANFAAYGFVELYRNPEQGYPPESNVLFGKTWLMYEINRTVSVGAELEYGYNNAGMYSRSRPFSPDQFRVLPKFGVSIKLLP